MSTFLGQSKVAMSGGVTAICSKQNARDLQPPYSHSGALSSSIHSRWAMKDLMKAAMLYLNALYIADGTGKGYRRVLLQGFKPESAVYRAVASEDIHLHILQFAAPSLGKRQLKIITSHFYHIPNLPAAIVHNNLSYVFLQLAGNKPPAKSKEAVALDAVSEPGPTSELDQLLFGKHRSWAELALRHALRSVVVCGEYEKGHHRLKACYERLGMNDLARETQEEMTDVTKLLKAGMTPFITLLMIGWINDIESMKYMTARFNNVIDRMRDTTDPMSCADRRFSTAVSMVPFDGGQYLSVGFSYLNQHTHTTQHVDCV